MGLMLNSLLVEANLDPKDCTVMLHTPKEPHFRRVFAALFLTRRHLFETYQSSHHGPATATLRGRGHTVTFIGMEDGTCVLAGVYRVCGHNERSQDWQRNNPAIDALSREFRIDYSIREGQTFFDLQRTGHLEDLTGRLTIAPRLTRAYVRLAENLNAEIVEIARESRFDAPPPPWRNWHLSGAEIRSLGPRQTASLREWRGIYMIIDESDGQRYVGAAYGADNLLGRWQAHVGGDIGVTMELSKRNPANFRFSILERVSPDMPPEDVIALERSWMDRLHSRQFGLNS